MGWIRTFMDPDADFRKRARERQTVLGAKMAEDRIAALERKAKVEDAKAGKSLRRAAPHVRKAERLRARAERLRAR